MRSSHAVLAGTLALAASLGSSRAGAVDWPGVQAEPPPVDPLRPLRFCYRNPNSEASPSLRRSVLEDLANANLPHARRRAFQAVALWVPGRDDNEEARVAIGDALRDDRGILEDPDVALLAARVAAAAGRITDAVELYELALQGFDEGCRQRDLILLEASRWSMARGAEGLDDALRMLFGFARIEVPMPIMVRATLALALARAGRVDEARAVALAGTALQPYRSLEENPSLAWMAAEGDAALGVALLLRGDTREALEPLVRAARAGPAPWRDFQNAQLAAVRRGTPAPAPGSHPPGGRVLQ